jgi:hypothetical protein
MGSPHRPSHPTPGGLKLRRSRSKILKLQAQESKVYVERDESGANERLWKGIQARIHLLDRLLLSRKRASGELDSDNEAVARKLLKKRVGEMAHGRLLGPSEERLTFEDLGMTAGRIGQIRAQL